MIGPCKLFTYSDPVLTDIEQAPDKLFESMNKARSILKKLLHEKVTSLAENSSTHISKRGWSFLTKAILTGNLR